ncbi:hypothetical protein ACVWZR_009882 [Bradyrhizobium sp. i1.3.1]
MTGNDDKEAEKPFLNTVEAAAWLRLTKNTLEKMRVTSGNDALLEQELPSVIAS